MNFWCVGRNYAKHARELGNEPPGEPMIFLKAGSCVVRGPEVRLPSFAKDVHHEIELALEFGPDLRFHSMALAIDLTERELQGRLKDKGHPWTLAKSFKDACPLSGAVPLQPLRGLRLQLSVNGELRQDDTIDHMIFPPDLLREFVTERCPVEPGDWLLTGTPAGVGPVRRGDILEGALLKADGVALIEARWRMA